MYEQSLDEKKIVIRVFRKKHTSDVTQVLSIVPEILLLPHPPVAGQLVAESEQVNVAPHPLTASTGTILAVSLDLVASEFHLKSAIHRGLFRFAEGAGKTKAALTEVLYNLANTGNINEAIRQFLVTKDTTEFAVLRIADDAETVALYDEITTALLRDTAVEEFSLSELSETLRENAEKREKLKNVFKLTVQESAANEIELAVITKLALKDFMN